MESGHGAKGRAKQHAGLRRVQPDWYCSITKGHQSHRIRTAKVVLRDDHQKQRRRRRVEALCYANLRGLSRGWSALPKSLGGASSPPFCWEWWHTTWTIRSKQQQHQQQISELFWLHFFFYPALLWWRKGRTVEPTMSAILIRLLSCKRPLVPTFLVGSSKDLMIANHSPNSDHLIKNLKARTLRVASNGTEFNWTLSLYGRYDWDYFSW